MGLPKNGDVLVHLTIQIPDGPVIFNEDWMLKSGSEVYGEKIRKSGVKAGKQRLVITVAQPSGSTNVVAPAEAITAFQLPSERAAVELTERGKISVLVNRFERNRQARAECIKSFGTACSVCGFDFEKRYGNIGKGFIHVHHLTPVSQVGKDYKIDPSRDLRPVCPNCHEMLHSRPNTPLSIEELQIIIEKNRSPAKSRGLRVS